MYIGDALYWICARLINYTAINVLICNQTKVSDHITVKQQVMKFNIPYRFPSKFTIYTDYEQSVSWDGINHVHPLL